MKNKIIIKMMMIIINDDDDSNDDYNSSLKITPIRNKTKKQQTKQTTANKSFFVQFLSLFLLSNINSHYVHQD